MRFFLRLILIAGLAYWAQLHLPFWSAAVIAFATGLLLSEKKIRRSFGRKKNRKAFSFWAGFLALFLLWGGMAFYLDLDNNSILSSKISQYLLKVEQGPLAGPYPMILLTALIGGLIGGFSALTGNLLGEALKSA